MDYEQSVQGKNDGYDNARNSSFSYAVKSDDGKSFKLKSGSKLEIQSIGNMGLDCIGLDMIDDIIQEQEEENFEDMISHNLVLLEYDIF